MWGWWLKAQFSPCSSWCSNILNFQQVRSATALTQLTFAEQSSEGTQVIESQVKWNHFSQEKIQLDQAKGLSRPASCFPLLPLGSHLGMCVLSFAGASVHLGRCLNAPCLTMLCKQPLRLAIRAILERNTQKIPPYASDSKGKGPAILCTQTPLAMLLLRGSPQADKKGRFPLIVLCNWYYLVTLSIICKLRPLLTADREKKLINNMKYLITG